MSILTTAEITQITSDIREIVQDDVVSTDIVYCKSGTTGEDTYDPTTGVIPDMYAKSNVLAFAGSYSIDEISQSGGMIEKQDMRFIIMTSSVSGVLSPDDRVVKPATTTQSATTYEIRTVRTDPLQICWFLQGREV